MKTTKHLRVFGRVQGVFFRASMCRKAALLNVVGWVRNRQDSSLEATLQGDAAAIAQLIDWVRHGPPNAHVERIEVSEGN